MSVEWRRRSFVFKAENQAVWWEHSTLAPAPLALPDGRIRVYVGGRAPHTGISRIGWVDVDGHDPSRVLGVSKKPVLDLGRPGTFDDNGVFPATVLWVGSRVFLYYTGFQLPAEDKQADVRYFMFGGLAVSEDGGETFTRASEAPVTDRADEGLYFRGGPSVLADEDGFIAAYSAGSGWEPEVGGNMRPTYTIFWSRTSDGIEFPRRGTQCFAYDPKTEHGLGRPWLYKTDRGYHMVYCVRTKDMRYGAGYACSKDGNEWRRDDAYLGLSHGEEGSWDSEMVYFPSYVKTAEKEYIFYTGNDFSRAGFGFAEIASW